MEQRLTFISPEPVKACGQDVIPNTFFFPDLDIAAYRDDMRQDGTVTPARLRLAMLSAIAEVNAELHDYRLRMMGQGYLTLADVPAEDVDGESQRLMFYRRAVWCWTKANLIERFRDYDAMPEGNKKADLLGNTLDQLWRDVRWAINRVQDRPHMTVELI
ncbi:head completion/stabilization protein [Citrobacter portucalensis]|uniref:head completion/stabilization protein n=1 Tax=Citrobacter portucalensis TaxID=1639133 RepID=UPI00226B7E75|nr:head completion/stabilization protein [Citrobacter portucalensis]MCX9038814.1 head completion/stabilization protein [Citrobacter portucalensis]